MESAWVAGTSLLLEKSDWADCPNAGPLTVKPILSSAFARRGSARRDRFYVYKGTQHSAGTATRQPFERTHPPHKAWPVALVNSLSCQLPIFAAQCHGKLIVRCATSATVDADAWHEITARTCLERMADGPAGLDRKARHTHSLIAVGGWCAMFVVGGADR